jgi:hypothetical protein
VVEATMTGIARETAAFQQQLADAAQAQLDGLTSRFGDSVTKVADVWTTALAQHTRTSEDLVNGLEQSLSRTTETLEQRSTSLLASVDRAHAAMRAESAASEEQRLAALTQSLQSIGASLKSEWQQAGVTAHSQQEQICKTLQETANVIHTQAEAQAQSTITEVSRLIEAASEAPRAAAEVVALLRQKLAESTARDNDLLDERARIMGTLNTLLDAVNRGATEQRGAIEALVASSAAVLQQVGAQFTEKVEAEATKMSAVATQISSSAVEVSSLGEAFSLAVQLFSESSEALTSHLQRIEAALNKSTMRSDEQLAYYVAQAREIIDLSIASQKQIVDDLRQLSGKQAAVAGEAA